MLELSKLYRYSNNLMCAVDMTGRQLYNWMSKVADMYTIKDGKAALADGVSIYGVDTFYGVDYTFDLTRPVGHRIASAKINGVDLLKYDGKIRVALNSLPSVRRLRLCRCNRSEREGLLLDRLAVSWLRPQPRSHAAGRICVPL
jgi:hypothetical protein